MTTTCPTSRRSLFARLHLTTWRGRFAWFLTLLALALFTCWLLARITPAWYRPLDPDDHNVDAAANRAQSLLAELHNAVDRIMSGPQRWAITQDEVNSLLAVKTAPPFDATGKRGTLDPSRYPLTDPYVVFSKDAVTLCARYAKLPGGDAQGGVASITFSVGTVPGEDGSVMGLVKLSGVSAGHLPLPKSALQDRLNANSSGISVLIRQLAQIDLGEREMKDLDPVIQQMVRGAIDGRPFAMEYRSKGRSLAVKELKVEPGRLSVLLVPLPPAASAPVRALTPPAPPAPISPPR
jgi:hypothetical protein